jgi:hypothetical protein
MNQEGVLLEEEKEFKRFYKFSLWWVNHRVLLRRIGFGVFIAVNVLLLSFAVWSLLDAFAISYDREQRAVVEMVAYGQDDLHAYTLANAAKPLEPTDAKVISIGDQRYDIYAELLNPNDDWWAEFTYFFLVDDLKTDPKDGFILPSDQKPVVHFAYRSEVPVREGELVIESVQWRRIDHHAISDYPAWIEDRLNMEIEDTVFTRETGFGENVYGRTDFTVLNNTAFSFYDPGFFIVLLRGSSVVGVNRTRLSDLDSGEELQTSVNWFGTLPSVSQVKVIPEIHVFDLGTYKPLTGETTRDTRTRVFGR